MAVSIEERWARQNKQKLAQRRAAGARPIEEYQAEKRARADAVARKADALGLSIHQLRRRIRLGRLPHPSDVIDGGGDE